MNEIITEDSDNSESIQIFDNGGYTTDRYTVYFPNSDYHIRMSDYPTNPRGILQKETGKPSEDRKLGKRIAMNADLVRFGVADVIERELASHNKALFL